MTMRSQEKTERTTKKRYQQDENSLNQIYRIMELNRKLLSLREQLLEDDIMGPNELEAAA
ncbi:MAG: hypothetical protein ACFFBS_05760 [Promethearchaeota archaeon]